MKIQGFTDADWVGSPSDIKSTSGGIFSIGSTIISWYNRKQQSVALSLAEAEYMGASQVACEAIWMRKILVGLFGSQMDPIMIIVIIRVALNSRLILCFMIYLRI